MKKHEINPFDRAGDILSALGRGILLTTQAGDKRNAMTIGWGALGIEWGKPVFITYVREGRFTASQLAKNPEFTVCIPTGSFDKKILGYCGSRTGRDIDKIADLGLTAVPGECVASPAIAELPLTLECRVLYSRRQQNDLLPPELFNACYPQNIGSEDPMANRDFHIEYYGEIVRTYILEP